jgi:diguanylate cyclase (GGDEF)-like protein/PAS domain S-box-containing protein
MGAAGPAAGQAQQAVRAGVPRVHLLVHLRRAHRRGPHPGPGHALVPPVLGGLDVRARGAVPPVRGDERELEHRVYGLALVFFLLTVCTELINDGIERTAGGWSYTVSSGVLPWTYDAFVAACLLPGLVTLYVRGRRAEHPARRRQALIITASGALTLLGIYLLDRLPHMLRLAALPSTAHAVMLLWMAGVAWSVVRYRLFSLTPERAARSIVDAMNEGLMLFDEQARLLRLNPRAAVLVGRSEDDLLGRPVEEVLGSRDLSREVVETWLGRSGRFEDHEVEISREADAAVLSVSGSRIVDDYGQVSGFVMVMHDHTERRATVDQLHHMATHDALTGLPNRRLLHDRLAQAMARARRYGHHLALMLVDLDHFKQINDTLGHDAGDELLVTVAERLRRRVRESDTVARLGGDEFVVLATDLPKHDLGSRVLSRVHASFDEPIPLAGRERRVTASIGACRFPGDGESAPALMRCADEALYLVKERGRAGCGFYESPDPETG